LLPGECSPLQSGQIVAFVAVVVGRASMCARRGHGVRASPHATSGREIVIAAQVALGLTTAPAAAIYRDITPTTSYRNEPTHTYTLSVALSDYTRLFLRIAVLRERAAGEEAEQRNPLRNAEERGRDATP
jgi:hypothetical protein